MLALEVFATVGIVTLAVNLLLYKKLMIQVAGLLFGKIRKNNGSVG